jgi:hypothetical protein
MAMVADLLLRAAAFPFFFRRLFAAADPPAPLPPSEGDGLLPSVDVVVVVVVVSRGDIGSACWWRALLSLVGDGLLLSSFREP